MVQRSIRSKKDFLVFGAPVIEEEEINEVVSSLKSGWIGTGPKVQRFEKDFKAFKGVPFAVAVNSCTAALHLSLQAAGIGEGAEVITSAMTFCSTVNAIIHAGAIPVLADIDPETLNIDPKDVEKKITPRTRALLPVHFAGRPCDMDALTHLAQKHNLIIIEDCAHAIEAEYKGRKTGTFGDFGCFSFYVTKNIITGEGGMVLPRREQDASKIKILALHGMSEDAWNRFGDDGYRHYYVVDAGYKYNMMDIQAAIGIHQLKRIESYWKKREALWNFYNQELARMPLCLPADPEPGSKHAYHLYTVLVDEEKTGVSRDAFLDRMKDHNIGVGVHYLSLTEHPYYQQRFGWKTENCPHAFRVGRQTISLPLSPKLSDKDAGDVVEAVGIILK